MQVFTPTRVLTVVLAAPIAVAAVATTEGVDTASPQVAIESVTETSRTLPGSRTLDDPPQLAYEDPEPDPGPHADYPDIAVQFVDFRSGDGACLAGNDLDGIMTGIAEFVGMDDPDVRHRCLDGAISRIGVWEAQPDDADDIADRELGLFNVPIPEQDDIGFYIKSSYVIREAQDTFWNGPRRYNEDGVRATDGPIHLTDLRVRFQAPGHVVTEIDGYHDGPFPDVHFTMSIDDTITDSCLADPCEGVVSIDKDDLDVFLAIIDLSFLTALDLGEPQARGGAGAAALAMIPQSIPIPGRQKIIPVYQHAEVALGIVAGGSYLAGPRSPAFEIDGPRTVRVPFEQGTATFDYGAIGVDTLGALDAHWSSDGQVSSPTQNRTHIRFIGGAPGTVSYQHVRVEGSDSEGAITAAEIDVRVETYRATPDGNPIP